MPDPLGSSDSFDDTVSKFEREKWLADCDFRKQELEIKQQEEQRLREELQYKIQELRRSRWSSPLVLAILGAIFAGFGNIAVTWLNGRNAQTVQEKNNGDTVKLETFKAESGRILEAIKTGDPDKAAVNLKFLIDTSLIADDQTVKHVKAYLQSRRVGEGAALPAAGPAEPPLPSQCPYEPARLAAMTTKELITLLDGEAADEDQIKTISESLRAALGGKTLTNAQFNALVSLSYNIGLGNVRTSSILRFTKEDELEKAADGFLLWNKAAGKAFPGLHLRRLCERELFRFAAK